MTRIDLTAASDPRKVANMILGSFAASASATSRAMTTEPAPTPEPEPSAPNANNPEGLDLFAFTHCPECGYIYHRATGCAYCHPAGAAQ